jgi:hypothetical protein
VAPGGKEVYDKAAVESRLARAGHSPRKRQAGGVSTTSPRSRTCHVLLRTRPFNLRPEENYKEIIDKHPTAPWPPLAL